MEFSSDMDSGKADRASRGPAVAEPSPPYRAYFAHSPLAIMVVDAAGRYVEVNPAACQLTGFQEPEFLAMSVADVMAEESRNAGLRLFARTKEAGHASGEFAVVRKDGSRRWVTCDAVKLTEDRFIAFTFDMTERRNAEDALRRSQAELRAIYDHSPIMMCVIDADRRVLYCNRAMSLFVGKPEEELTGDRACGILGCINALDDPRGCGYGPRCNSCSLREAILDTIQTGATHIGITQQATVEHAGIRRNVVFSACTSLIQHEGQANLLLCLVDITERVRAEEATKAAEFIFHTVADNTYDWEYWLGADGQFIYCSPSCERITGHSPAEFLADADLLLDIVHPEDRQVWTRHWHRVDRDRQSCSLTFRVQTPGDEIRWLEHYCQPILNSQGQYCGQRASNRDITDRKFAEAILVAERDLALRLLSLQDPMDIIRACLDAAIALSGLECGGIYVADAVSRKLQLVHHTGLSPEFAESVASYPADSVQQQVHRNEKPVVITRQEMQQYGLASAVQEGLSIVVVIPVLTEGSAVACLNLATRTARTISPHVMVGLESVAAQMGTAIACAFAEESRRQSEERYRLLVEAAPCSILVVQDGHYAFANPYAERMLGYPSHEVTQVPVFETIHPASRDEVLHRMKTVDQGKANPPIEIRVVRKDGTVVETETTSVPITFGGRPAALVVGQDVTERKQAEARVRLLADLLDASPASTTVHDVHGNFLYANEKTFTLHGFSREEFFGLNLHQLDVPESERLIAPRLQEIAETGWASFEVQHFRKDGTTIPLQVDAKLAQWGDKEVFLSVASDVSELKRTEHVLLEREARLRGILDAASESVFLIDPEGIVLECNETTARRLGKSVDELLGTCIYDLLPPHLKQSRMAKVQKVLESREPVQFEDERAGVWFEHTVYPVFDRSGKVFEFAIFGRDISERRRAEESLRESEERLRLATKATNDVIWDWDIVHDAQHWNEAGTAVFGWCDIVEQPQTAQWWLHRVHPDDRQRVEKAFHAVYASPDRCHWQDEYRFLKADGTYAFVLDRGYVMRDEQGKAVRMIGAMLDLTGRRQAEESLRQSEEHFRVLVETMLQGVVHQDKDGTIISMNPAAQRILGKAPEEFLGSSSVGQETWTIREDGSPFPGLEHPAMVALRTGQQVRGVVMGVFNPRMNAYRWINLDAVPLFRPGEEHPYQVYTVFEDITDRKRAEQQHLEMERRLLHAQKLESLGILAGGIAHDFNNILAGIMGYADLVKLRLPPSEPAREDVEVIKTAVQRAANLTRQMLAYSGKGKFAIEAVDLSRIVADTRKMLEVSVSKKATLSYNLASGLPAIEADPSQVHQVVLNLVINASEALGDDSGIIAVTTYAVHLDETEWETVRISNEARAAGYVCLEVADTGCGMSRETLAKIFDPFFTTKFTGRGLGLAALHGIVRGHKGGLRVASEPGKGTTFQVFFPASAGATVASVSEAATTSWQGRGTVLVVDDEEIVRNIAKSMMEHAGFSVLSAQDGKEAIDVYRQHRSEIVCVLLDLTMPKMNGEETLRELRAINPNICVILSSGFSEDNALQRFSQLGLDGFIQKPYQLATMLDTLQRALPRFRPDSDSQRELPRSQGGTVLLVDDDAMNRLSTHILFKQAGFSVLTARDGEEAIQVFQTHREQIVCVFLDWNLPTMNGVETLRTIRQLDRRVQAMVTSGCDVDTMRRRFAGLDVLAFHQKPESLDTVIERLREAIRTRAHAG